MKRNEEGTWLRICTDIAVNIAKESLWLIQNWVTIYMKYNFNDLKWHMSGIGDVKERKGCDLLSE